MRGKLALYSSPIHSIHRPPCNQVDRHRILSLDGPGFDDAIQTDHSGATVEVAQAFSALGTQLTPNIKLGADLVKARSMLAGKRKALESL